MAFNFFDRIEDKSDQALGFLGRFFSFVASTTLVPHQICRFLMSFVCFAAIKSPLLSPNAQWCWVYFFWSFAFNCIEICLTWTRFCRNESFQDHCIDLVERLSIITFLLNHVYYSRTFLSNRKPKTCHWGKWEFSFTWNLDFDNLFSAFVRLCMATVGQKKWKLRNLFRVTTC